MTPSPGVDPRDSLATSIYSAPGVYAFLVGSGLSSAAGVLTGERIIADLIRMVARNRGVDLEAVDPNPQAWWEAETRTLARYDDLLRDLARTDGARQAILRRYFEVHPETGQPIAPTPGHEALASLCASGLVRVILTTNFDDLIERSLEAAGVAPQVLSTDGAIKARIPLAHAGCTVVKLHGDFRRLGLRNTPMELSKYGAAQRALLRQVFDEYGLVVVGWSAEWDTALAESLERTPSRRYPTYWAIYRGQLTPTARHLAHLRSACEVATEGADDFLPDLVQRVDRLQVIAARRQAPTIQGTYQFPPQDSATAPGWSAVPLLLLRTAALAAPVPVGSVGLIGPEQRERIRDALRYAALHRRLADLNLFQAVSASPPPKDMDAEVPTPGSSVAPPLVGWYEPDGARQSLDQAVYRLGGDAALGVSALAEVRLPHLPGYAHPGGALFTLDVAVSIEVKLAPSTIATVLRDGLVLTGRLLPEAVGDLLPSDVSVVRCDCHLVAPRSDGAGGWRENTLEARMDTTTLRSLTSPNPTLDHSLGFGALVPGPPTDVQAAAIVADGFNYMALAVGYLDPRQAVKQIRVALGLSAES